MINKIWGLFIVVGSVFCLITNKVELLNTEILESTKSSLDMIIKIFPVMALWMGIMNIAKVSGLLQKFSKAISPLLRKIFPEIPPSHESLSLIASNIIANMFGLGNAATPFGLKAMKSLQELNNKKDTASRSMITFLVLNTSGLTLIPISIIALRNSFNSINPSIIIIPCIISTSISTIFGLLLDYIIRRKYVK